MNPWIGLYSYLFLYKKEIDENVADIQDSLSKDDESCQDAIMSLVFLFCIMIIGTIVSVIFGVISYYN